jgi:hypothetical protein
MVVSQSGGRARREKCRPGTTPYVVANNIGNYRKDLELCERLGLGKAIPKRVFRVFQPKSGS